MRVRRGASLRRRVVTRRRQKHAATAVWIVASFAARARRRARSRRRRLQRGDARSECAIMRKMLRRAMMRYYHYAPV